MSDSIKKYEEMVENGEISKDKLRKPFTSMKYIWVLDFTDGKIYKYDIIDWDIDNKCCEEFLIEMGHNLHGCKWMVTESKFVETPNLQN